MLLWIILVSVQRFHRINVTPQPQQPLSTTLTWKRLTIFFHSKWLWWFPLVKPWVKNRPNQRWISVQKFIVSNNFPCKYVLRVKPFQIGTVFVLISWYIREGAIQSLQPVSHGHIITCKFDIDVLRCPKLNFESVSVEDCVISPWATIKIVTPK